MSAKPVTIVVTLLAACIITARAARAETGLLVMGGNATDRERTAIGGAVENAIRTAGWTLSPKALSKKDSDGLLKCPDSKSPWTCIPSSLSTKGINGAFVISIDLIQSDNGAPVVAIAGKMITTNPPAFAVRERYCERCADDKLAEAGEDVIQQLTRELAKRSGRTVVVIKSVPSSGTLIFDGEQLGGTDATFATFPGKHTAMVQKPGFISEIREFTVDEGKTAEITLTLRPSAVGETKHDPPPSEPSRRTPLIIIGAGSALTVFGTISLIQGQRDAPKFDYTRATAVGVTVGALGLGAVGAGLYLLWRKPDGAAPTASISSNGVALGWAGRF
jgi:hypothetical protein